MRIICAYLILFFSVGILASYGQGTPPPDSSKPAIIPINAGFDVIIKRNGDILYGVVKEVGLILIRYQRTDIPDGPIYTVPRAEVYAISYRNQVKDILNPLSEMQTPHDTVVMQNALPGSPPAAHPKKHDLVSSSFFRNGNVRIGLGFLRSYTKVDQVSQYSSHATFPVISIAYDVPFKEQVRMGIQISFGPHKFTGQQFSSYDSTNTSITLKENIFMLHVYGKYNFAYHTDRLQPYILAGIGINSSHINSNYYINFINNPNDELSVKSGSNSVGIGIMARIGTEVYLNSKTRLFGDLGIGASVLNFGVSLNVD